MNVETVTRELSALEIDSKEEKQDTYWIDVCFTIRDHTPPSEPPRLLSQSEIVHYPLVVLGVHRMTEQEFLEMHLPKLGHEKISAKFPRPISTKTFNLCDILFERLIESFRFSPLRFQVVTHWRDLNDPVEMMSDSQCLMVIRSDIVQHRNLWQEEIIIMKADLQFIKKFCTDFFVSNKGKMEP